MFGSWDLFPDNAYEAAVTAEVLDVKPNGNLVLQARKLVKTYGRVVGLDGLDLELHAGEVLAIIGDNGASAEGSRHPAR